MEFIRKWKEESMTKRQQDIERQAEETIRLSDFDGAIYIAYNGTPLVPIESSWTSVEIVNELSKLRKNFVNSRMKENGLPRMAAAL